MLNISQLNSLNLDNLTPEVQRNSIVCKVLWQGNPINVVKTFGTPNCALCNKERLEILKQSRKDPNSLINSCNEIYGACRHNSKFHRYISRTPSTDESNKDERVTLTQPTTDCKLMCGMCLTEVWLWSTKGKEVNFFGFFLFLFLERKVLRNHE